MSKSDPTKGWPSTATQSFTTPTTMATKSTTEPALRVDQSPAGSIYALGQSLLHGGVNIYNGFYLYTNSNAQIVGAHNAVSGTMFSVETSRDTGGHSAVKVNFLGNVLVKSSINAPEALRLQTQGATSESLVIEDLRDNSTVLSIDVDGNFSGTSSATTWKSFTPVLSGSTWAIGNGVLVGTYSKIGKTVHFSIELIFGSTSVYGTGTPQISITPAGVTSGAVAGTAFNATYTDDSTGNRYAGRGVLQLGSLGAPHMYTLASPMTTLTDTVPFTWATGDSIAMTGTYQTV